MKSSSYEIRIQQTYDSFCKKLLKNEAINYNIAVNRKRNNERLFSELSEQEMELLSIMDEYPSDQHSFNVSGYDVAIKSELLADALTVLPKQKRDILLLYHFLGMTDKEIGKLLHLVRQTVQYQRTSSIQQLKKYMEEQNNE